jgi:dihydroorotase
MERYDLILKGGHVVTPWGVETADVAVRDGRIATLGSLRGAEAAETIDCAGLHVLPGLIDPHVHLRDPGDPSVESIETGTKAAVLGGLAAVFDMPNTAMPAWKP